MSGRRVNRWLLVWLLVGLSLGGSLIGSDPAEARSSELPLLSHKPEPVHFLGRRAAKKYMRAILIQRFSYDHRAGGSINCRKRLSRTRVACTMAWGIGDSGYFGRGKIWLTFPFHEKQAHFSYRLTSVDEYCVHVTQEGDCTRRLRDRGLVSPSLLRFLRPRTPQAEPLVDGQASAACPDPAAIERPPNPRGAIPAAKELVGSETRVLEVKRGPRSTYAALANHDCGVKVLRKSVYVNLHPVGVKCVSCNSQLYVVAVVRGGALVDLAVGAEAQLHALPVVCVVALLPHHR